MISKRSYVFSFFFAGCCICSFAFSQDGKADKKSRANNDPRAAVKAWDKNKDGMLEMSEVPKEQRGKVSAWATKKGLDPKEPMKLDTLFSKGKAGGNSGKEKLSQEEKDAKKAARKKAKEKKVANKKESTENAKSFGATARARIRQRTAERTSSKDDKPDGGKDKKDSGEQRRRGAFRFAARSLMYQNDKNKNGRLEKSEWTRLKGSPGKADKNKDGSLSMEELTDHLAGYGSDEEKPRPKYRQVKRRVNSEAGKKSYRFLTPQERLPEGLPDWFAERDENSDGQISLKEYAPSLTSSKYKKFAQLDLNNDGLLVAKEYLKATK